jgi:hypothetical protein
MKPSGFSQAIRMVEYFKFGSKSESGEFPFMFLSDGAQTRYLDHRSSVTDHDPILIYVNSGDKFEHTALGTILLIVNKDCRVVKATLDNANGIEANAENCKAAPPGKEWKNGILNTLCERYFQWAKEVKSVGSTLENRPIIAPTARKVSATPAR